MKLEVGMYVRTDSGVIGKIYEKIGDMFTYKDSNRDYITYGLGHGEILKANHNIKDLIEEDDLIKCKFGEQILILQVGVRYTTSNPENGWVKGVFTLDNEFWSLETLIQEDILQSIVTKEQFESISYKVVE